jgi:hypothetical protein
VAPLPVLRQHFEAISLWCRPDMKKMMKANTLDMTPTLIVAPLPVLRQHFELSHFFVVQAGHEEDDEGGHAGHDPHTDSGATRSLAAKH